MMRVSKWVFLSCLSLAAGGGASDDDGDGFTDKDCDDNNATVNPDADEVCDGIDNNCDGRVDEGLILEYYADLDGDGYGDALTTVSACTLPMDTSSRRRPQRRVKCHPPWARRRLR